MAIASFLVPFIHRPQQHRHASILGSLSDNAGAYNKRIRRGRGPSSGKGKTSGRGHKGQKQHGKVPRGFNGGQTPIEVVKGLRGFKNVHAPRLSIVNVEKLQEWIDQGRLDNTKPITLKELHESRCTHGIKDGVKLLARNATALHTPIHITVSRASAAAIAAIEAAGGSVQTRYYTYHSIQRILRGLSHPTQSLLSPPPPPNPPPATAIPGPDTPEGELVATAVAAAAARAKPASEYRFRLPDPAGRKDIEYYRDSAHRGYLSGQVKEGESPSLFFKNPGVGVAAGVAGGVDGARKAVKARAGKSSDDRLW